jgi:hypothetical protein
MGFSLLSFAPARIGQQNNGAPRRFPGENQAINHQSYFGQYLYIRRKHFRGTGDNKLRL